MNIIKKSGMTFEHHLPVNGKIRIIVFTWGRGEATCDVQGCEDCVRKIQTESYDISFT